MPGHHFFIQPAANPITAPPSLHLLGQRSHRHATIFSAGRRIPSPHHHLFSGMANLIAAPQSFQQADESHRGAAIVNSGPANPIAAPQSFPQAGKSHRRAAIFSAGRQILSPRRNHFSRPANPITAPQSSAGQQIPSPRRNLFSGPANPIAAPPALICCIKIYSKKPHHH